MLRRLLFSVVPVLCVIGCDDESMPEGATMLAIGDSYYDFGEKDVSPPNQAADILGEIVWNKAIGGTRMLGGPDAIPGQYESGMWDWVMISGGGNDVGPVCEDNNESAQVIDEILSEDGTSGVMVDLVDQIIADGGRVVITGYGQLLPDRGDFLGCEDELEVLEARGAALTANNPDVLFVPLSDDINPSEPGLFAEDGVHLSEAGSAVAGQLIAQAITDAGQ
ncbi:MAG: SGNH/GDSL hydrolase family protein [Myxococcota bacterium]